MNDNELKPCPFCGKDKASLYLSDDIGNKVYCQSCGAAHQWCTQPEDAIAAWNRRPQSNPISIRQQYIVSDTACLAIDGLLWIRSEDWSNHYDIVFRYEGEGWEAMRFDTKAERDAVYEATQAALLSKDDKPTIIQIGHRFESANGRHHSPAESLTRDYLSLLLPYECSEHLAPVGS